VSAATLIAVAAASAWATSYPMPLFEQSERERFEAMVNHSDVVCEARVDSTYYRGGARRTFVVEASMWKGDSISSRFEVVGWQRGFALGTDVPVPGLTYRLFLWRMSREHLDDSRDDEGPPLFAVVAVGRAPDPPWWWPYSRATVDTIVARARLDTLYNQAPLVVLARRVGRVKHDRDGQPVLSSLLRVDRVLKGVPPADTLVYQAPDEYRHWDRALLFLKRHGADAWEPVSPGAGVHEFDWDDRETHTGERLQSFLDELDRLAGRAAKP
jgi:hypothetical protein